jgi:multicomponent Na+:H+ antiporter subunit E
MPMLARSIALLRLLWLFLYELIVSSVQVAWDVVTPRHLARPGIIALPLDARTDVEITVLANLICLTPGSLSLEVSADRRVLYVHTMFIDDAEASRRSLKQVFERRVLEALR